MSDVLKLFNKSLNAAMPKRLLSNFLGVDDNYLILGEKSRVLKKNLKIISFGKAGGSMIEAFINKVGEQHILDALVVYPENLPKPNININNKNIIPSSHPYVTYKSVFAGDKIIEFSNKCSASQTVFCLVSGGGSALIASPIRKVNFEDKINLINNLIKKGIGEREVNIIRKKLSNIKGGSLAEKIFPSQIINLILSDERNHQIEAIASGPTVFNKSKMTSLDIIEKNNLWDLIPSNMHQIFYSKKDSGISEKLNIKNYIIGSRENVLEEISKSAKKLV